LDVHVLYLNFNMCACVEVYGCVFTHFAMDYFEGAMKATVTTRWWWHLLCAEICWRFANVEWTYFVHVELVMQINFHTMHGTYSIKIRKYVKN